MDIAMPTLNGYYATKQIRLFNSNVKIIMQTAFHYGDEEKESVEAGCDGFLTKPINRTALIEMISKFFNS